MNSKEELVHVFMVTYNHENYIAQAIESVLMQETTFKYKLIIGEDCSTDRTREIVEQYVNNHPMKITVFFNNKNLGPQKNAAQIYNACSAKYVALLEGDDFWIDPFKLQKQVDFLEANPNYGLVYTNYQKLNDNTKESISLNCDRNIKDGEAYDKYMISSFIGTCTVLARKVLINEYLDKFNKERIGWAMGDRPLWMYILSKTKCGFLKEYTAVYRRNNNSISSFNDVSKEIDFFKRSYDIRFYFIKHVRMVSELVQKQVDDSYHRGLLNYYSAAKNEVKSVKHYLKINNKNNMDYLIYLKSRSPIHNISVQALRVMIKIAKKTKRYFRLN